MPTLHAKLGRPAVGTRSCCAEGFDRWLLVLCRRVVSGLERRDPRSESCGAEGGAANPSLQKRSVGTHHASNGTTSLLEETESVIESVHEINLNKNLIQ